MVPTGFSRPFGTPGCRTALPNVEIETLGYCHMSLRDKGLSPSLRRDGKAAHYSRIVDRCFDAAWWVLYVF